VFFFVFQEKNHHEEQYMEIHNGLKRIKWNEEMRPNVKRSSKSECKIP